MTRSARVTSRRAEAILASVPIAPTDLADAARALSRGEPLAALAIVGRAESALGLALRGIAYAQMGDLAAAKRSLERALRKGPDSLTAARVRAALVEVALGRGDVASAAREAEVAAAELTRLGDARNAAMQRLVLARAEVLLGRLGEAQRSVEAVLAERLAPDVRAVAWLARAEIAIRAAKASDARDALAHARGALREAPNPLLARELAAYDEELSRPVARILRDGVLRAADLFAIEEASRGDLLLVDACRRLVLGGRVTVPLARRPVLFTLLYLLARGFPAAIHRDSLIAGAFEARRPNESHRARLRVEIGRLRKALDGLSAEPVATRSGYALASKRPVAVLLPASDDDTAYVAHMLADGAAWSAQSLAEHTGVSKRTAQRALGALVASGGAVRVGTGRSARYVRPGAPIASRLLLLGLAPAT